MRSFLADTFATNFDRYLETWKELLRFPSVGTDPDHDADCLACAKWLAGLLRAMGFESRLLPTPGKPVVFAERAGDRPGPVVLFYGHYDVQPADPIEAWKTPPFEPALIGRRLYARGAEDNKGQLLYVLHAMEALIRNRTPLPPLKVILEGDEESGSGGLSAVVSKLGGTVKADVLMVTDTGNTGCQPPSITMGCRGICGLTAILRGPHRDVHSGTYGGAVPNPAAGMARLLASLHRPDGRVAVEGFYDAVRPPTNEERRLANEPPVDPEDFRRRIGSPPVGGERRYTPAERTSFRPTVEVNGIHSGYGGAGSKTIIPSQAMAKLTVRLVPNQEPDLCLAALEKHLTTHTPAGLTLEIQDRSSGGPGFRLELRSPVLDRARRILDELSGRKTAMRWEGGSIGVLPKLQRVSGAELLIAGFGHEDDCVHAPNESFSIEQYRFGYQYAGELLASL